VSADTLVPEPNNPQSLNRYSYVNNRPLNFTDPTGNFSEEEIMKTFHVKTWEEVLAIFGKGGLLEGRWGWLETLRQAEVGDYVDIQWDSTLLPEGHAEIGDSFRGWFTKGREGQLLIGNKELGYYFDQLKAGLYGKQYDLTHYIREGIYGALTCVDGLACDTAHFSTSAIHDPYYRTQIKWEKFADPLAIDHLAVASGATVTALGLTVTSITAVEAACLNPTACAMAYAVMAPNMVAFGTATVLLARATRDIFMHEFTETVP
jgi:hypothetical protein